MNLEEIRTLAEIMSENGLTAIEITEGESNIRLEKNPPACVPAAPMPIPAVMPAAPVQAAPAAEAPAQESAVPASGSFSNLTEVKSPMVGVFYDSPSPEADPYVKVGDKVKKGDGELSIPLSRTQDILQYLGEHRPEGQFLCGFSMETQNMLENSRKKLEKKKVDMIAANNLKVPGAGFGTATNVITIITKDGEEELPLLSKEETADRLLTAILRERGKKD